MTAWLLRPLTAARWPVGSPSRNSWTTSPRRRRWSTATGQPTGPTSSPAPTTADRQGSVRRNGPGDDADLRRRTAGGVQRVVLVSEDYVAWDSGLLVDGADQIGDTWVYLVIAHEWGHAIQARLDTGLVAVADELQADCLGAAALFGAVADGTLEFEEGDEQEMICSLNVAGRRHGLDDDQRPRRLVPTGGMVHHRPQRWCQACFDAAGIQQVRCRRRAAPPHPPADPSYRPAVGGDPASSTFPQDTRPDLPGLGEPSWHPGFRASLMATTSGPRRPVQGTEAFAQDTHQPLGRRAQDDCTT